MIVMLKGDVLEQRLQVFDMLCNYGIDKLKTEMINYPEFEEHCINYLGLRTLLEQFEDLKENKTCK